MLLAFLCFVAAGAIGFGWIVAPMFSWQGLVAFGLAFEVVSQGWWWK